LESELEGYWLSRIGPPDGYLPVLKQITGRSKTLDNCIRCFRMILVQLRLKEIPDAKKLGRCLFWQALLLYQFSLASWGRWRKLFLEFGPTRYLGALIVPRGTSSTLLEKFRSDPAEPFENPCHSEFMARSVITMAQHQHALLRKL
jgi:hypothetical protein